MADSSQCRKMNLIWRMIGYAFTFVVHISNLVFMNATKEQQPSDISEDPSIKKFRELEYRYFTCWTVFIQILNAMAGFTCDAIIYFNIANKDFKLPEVLRKSREILFAGVVWPCSMVVCTIFWSIYWYDRNLIYPEFLDKIISPASNHIIHTLIVPIVVWEVVLRRREQPRSHARNIQQMALHSAIYLSVFYYTYFTEGIFLYPIFEVTYRAGMFHFIVLHVILVSLFFTFYYLQWFLNYLIHGNVDNMVDRKRKIK